MMELIESAIPVIQHAPTGQVGSERAPTRSMGSERSSAASDHTPPPTRHEIVERTGQDQEADARDRDAEVAALDATVAHFHRALERLRTQHAQLTSGALLQQYQRQTTMDVENSRPTTKVLSVQG